jgi:hypothetical protein
MITRSNNKIWGSFFATKTLSRGSEVYLVAHPSIFTGFEYDFLHKLPSLETSKEFRFNVKHIGVEEILFVF